jgi:hypothetical protein
MIHNLETYLYSVYNFICPIAAGFSLICSFMRLKPVIPSARLDGTAGQEAKESLCNQSAEADCNNDS